MEKVRLTYNCAECGDTHTTEKKYTKLPYSLDDITIGCHSEVIANPYSGAKYELDPVEEAIYSTIKGAEMFATMLRNNDVNYISLDKEGKEKSSKPPVKPPFDEKQNWDLVNSGCNWFRDNNSEAYMVLLD